MENGILQDTSNMILGLLDSSANFANFVYTETNQPII